MTSGQTHREEGHDAARGGRTTCRRRPRASEATDAVSTAAAGRATRVTSTGGPPGPAANHGQMREQDERQRGDDGVRGRRVRSRGQRDRRQRERWPPHRRRAAAGRGRRAGTRAHAVTTWARPVTTSAGRHDPAVRRRRGRQGADRLGSRGSKPPGWAAAAQVHPPTSAMTATVALSTAVRGRPVGLSHAPTLGRCLGWPVCRPSLRRAAAAPGPVPLRRALRRRAARPRRHAHRLDPRRRAVLAAVVRGVRGRPGAARRLPRRDGRQRHRHAAARGAPARRSTAIREIEVADVDGIVVLPGAAEPARARSPTAACPRPSSPPAPATSPRHASPPPGCRTRRVVVTASDVERGKPWPDPWLEGARRLEVDPARLPRRRGCRRGAARRPRGRMPCPRRRARHHAAEELEPDADLVLPDLRTCERPSRAAACAWPGHRVGSWMPTSSSWVPASPASSPRASSPMPAGRSCCSTRRARPTSAARRGGASGACSSSTAPSSAGWASPTPSTSPGRTGRAPPAGTASPRPTAAPAPTTGAGSGAAPTSSGPPARSGPG